MKARGRVFKYGDNVDTDVIIPARYLNVIDPEELGRHCFEDLDSAFVRSVRPGDVVVAGKNFGCGSSREHAPSAILAAGVGCVIAASFGRIFYRNAINVGLPILECPAAAAEAESGHEMDVDFDSGTVRNISTGRSHRAQPLPEFIRDIAAAGGLVNYLNRNLAGQKIKTRPSRIRSGRGKPGTASGGKEDRS